MAKFRTSPLATRIREAMPVLTEILLTRCEQTQHWSSALQYLPDTREDDADALLAAGLCMYGTGNQYGLPAPTDDPNRRECLIRAASLCIEQIQRMDRAATELAEDEDLAEDDSVGFIYQMAAELAGRDLSKEERAAIDHALRNDDMRAGALSYVESREHRRDTVGGPLRDLKFTDFEIAEPIE